MFCSQDIQAFVFLTIIYQICDVTMSISAWDNLLNNLEDWG